MFLGDQMAEHLRRQKKNGVHGPLFDWWKKKRWDQLVQTLPGNSSWKWNMAPWMTNLQAGIVHFHVSYSESTSLHASNRCFIQTHGFWNHRLMTPPTLAPCCGLSENMPNIMVKTNSTTNKTHFWVQYIVFTTHTSFGYIWIFHTYRIYNIISINRREESWELG